MRTLESCRGWAAVSLAALALLIPSLTQAQALRAQESAGTPIGSAAPPASQDNTLPPHVKQGRRFLARRGVKPSELRGAVKSRLTAIRPRPQSAGTSVWQPVGPTAVTSENFGLVTGRVAALALDPSDATGNKLYLGATGGGVWLSQNANAASAASVEFIPLTDDPSALIGALPASIGIGALTVQSGGTGVILAGTGDPNDALDSYYGAGILRSADGGKSWSLIDESVDHAIGGEQPFQFAGEGFAGFAWSTVNPELVVAAVSQAYEGTEVNATIGTSSYEGLYYSTDSGATWNLSTISDGSGETVQGPLANFDLPDGNAATSVVWNPVRKLFIAAVRFHGYYQSANGATWTRMAAQPGAGLTTALCPTNSGSIGSPACPIFRGSLAVNPQTGDTFAWTVNEDNQDQGLWQDKCLMSGGECSSETIAFGQQWNTAPLETDTLQGPATIVNGDYNLELTAIPFEQDTLLMLGDNDLWKCSLAAGCVWRNTTNANTCMSAEVGAYQHAIVSNSSNPLEIFVGNDSGVWRSTDAIGETGAVCNATDASHYQNLNGGLGSLAEVVSLSTAESSQYTMMAGLGANGTAGVKSSTRAKDWPEIENGEGGPTAIDPNNSANWYVNNQAGVSIHLCSMAGACTPSAFGQNPVVNDADVDGDGLAMTAPAPFLVDPADHTKLLIGTCRVWRGPADGTGWSGSNAISPILDGNQNNISCQGDALIRSIAALQTINSGEAIYVGMYGALDGGSTLAGHIFGAKFKPGSGNPQWQDLTLNPVTNDIYAMNAYGFDISSVFVDPHDITGNTIYVTVEAFATQSDSVRQVYRSIDGGTTWQDITANLPPVPANSVVVDPQDANTVYLATDAGVFSTRQVAGCAMAAAECWSAFGANLPESPVVALVAPPLGSAVQTLTAATYGRGIWQNQLWTAGTQLTTATVKPASLTFAAQPYGTVSNAQAVVLTDTGTSALTASIVMNGDFIETDDCQAAATKAGGNCTIDVKFAPSATGARSGTMTIAANVSGGQILVPLSGNGTAGGAVSLTPAQLDFDEVPVGTTSSPLEVTANNTSETAVSISSITATSPFAITAKSCANSIPAKTACQITIVFSPVAPGAASGKLTMTDGAGTQTVELSGDGATKATDTLSTIALTLPATVIGQLSAAGSVVMTNSGDLGLIQISAKATGEFQVSGNCGTELPGHASCVFSVKFAPTAAGSQKGVLTISDAIRTQTVQLEGTGEQPPKFSISPMQLSFPAQTVGRLSAAMLLKVVNTGGAPMANVSFNTSGESASSFLVSSTTCGAMLANGSSCTAQMKFIPAETGGNEATLVVSTSTIGVTAGAVALSGIGLPPPELAVSRPAIVFGNAVVGTRSAAMTVMISNEGGAALEDMHLAVSGNFAFSAGTCKALLNVGEKCTAQITFAPEAAGELQGVFTISSASGAAIPATVSLSGTGIGPATILTSSDDIEFEGVPAGQASAGKSVTITDSGTAGLSGLTLAVTGAFELQQDGCGATLNANKRCTTQVVFSPIAAGEQTGTLAVSSTTKFASPAVVTLGGTGLAEPMLAANPASLIFGGEQIGAKSVSLSVRVSNPGTGAVEGLILKATGDFQVTGNECGATLGPSGACTTSVVFQPGAAGSRMGTLTVSGSSSGLKPVVISLSGTGLAARSLRANVSNLIFGSETVDHSATPQLVTVTNTSAGAASGLVYRTSGDFAIEDNTCGATLDTAASCTMDIVFTPKSVGAREGNLTVSSSTAGRGSAVVAMSGTGEAAAYLTASPVRLAFAPTTTGSVSAAQTIVLSNPGIAAAGGLKASTTGDFSASVCATTLPAGENCTMKVVFSPTGEGVRAGKLTLTTTATGPAPVIVSLIGTGTAPPSIGVNPASLIFPGTTPGRTSAAQGVEVSNAGAVPLSAPKLVLTGDFHLVSNTCTAALPANGKCGLLLDFSPTAIGGRAGTLTLTSSTAGVLPVTVNLSGIGLTPAVIGVSPAEIAFPAVLRGQSSAPKTVTVTNAGGSEISDLNLTVSQQFALTANTCKGALAVGAHCTVEVYFKPIAEGSVSGGLSITSPSAAVPANVALSGTGGAEAAVVLTPAVVNFPTTAVGLDSNPVIVTVTNQGSSASLTGLTLRAGAGFRLTRNNCKSVLGPSASCTTGIEFAPASAGVQQATLAVTTAKGPSGAVALQGTGFDFSVKLQGVGSLTVASGQTAIYSMSIEPMNGSAGTFNFACGTLPANSICSFSPATESVGANDTGTVKVQIATGQSASGAAAATTFRQHSGRLSMLALGILLLPFVARRKSRILLPVALLAIFTAGVTSCVSASGGATSHPNPDQPGLTPPATYSIPVRVKADGLEHELTVTMNVD